MTAAPTRASRSRRTDTDAGQAAVELLALLPLLILVALIAVQVQLFVSTANAAENAARNAARVASDGGDPYGAAASSLAGSHRAGLGPGDVRVLGEEVVVHLDVPLISARFDVRPWSVTRSATFAD